MLLLSFSTMMKHNPVLKEKHLWKTILLLSFLCSGCFSTSLGPNVQFSLFILPTILLLTVEDLSNTEGKLNQIHVPIASECTSQWYF